MHKNTNRNCAETPSPGYQNRNPGPKQALFIFEKSVFIGVGRMLVKLGILIAQYPVVAAVISGTGAGADQPGPHGSQGGVVRIAHGRHQMGIAVGLCKICNGAGGKTVANTHSLIIGLYFHVVVPGPLLTVLLSFSCKAGEDPVSDPLYNGPVHICIEGKLPAGDKQSTDQIFKFLESRLGIHSLVKGQKTVTVVDTLGLVIFLSTQLGQILQEGAIDFFYFFIVPPVFSWEKPADR